MRKNNFHILAKEWFKKAEEDLGVAEHLLEERLFLSSACFHAHQTVEKYLKGFLVWHGKDIEDEFKIHTLPKLYEYALMLDGQLGENVKESCFLLNRYYIGTRYPANIPEFSWEEAKEAVRAARHVREAIAALLL